MPAGRSCGKGSLLVNSSLEEQECVQCPPLSYTLSALDGCDKTVCFPRKCRACPKGADCTGLQFTSAAEGSEWEEELASDGSGFQKRILSCPAGFTMLRDPLSPEQDDCLLCPEGKYRLTPVVWQDANSNSLPECHACPRGAACPGGNVVEAMANFWRLQTIFSGGHEYLDAASDVCQAVDATDTTQCLFPEGIIWLRDWSDDAPMHCTRIPEISTALVCARPSSTTLQSRTGVTNRRASNDSTPDVGTARVYPCVLRACGYNNGCKQNRTGPLCGFCSPDYAMTTKGCSPTACASEEELAPLRWTLIVFASVVVLVLWFIMSWRPVVPEVEATIVRMLSSISGLGCVYLCFDNMQGDTADLSRGRGCRDVLTTILGGFKWIWARSEPQVFGYTKTRFRSLRRFISLHSKFWAVLACMPSNGRRSLPMLSTGSREP